MSENITFLHYVAGSKNWEYHKIIKTKDEIELKFKTVNGKMKNKITSDSCNVFGIPKWENETNTYKKPIVHGKRNKYLKNKIEGLTSTT